MSQRITIADHFAALPDPRVERCRRHNLMEMLTIALCAVLCGADDFVAIQEWGQAKQDWLQQHLGLKLTGGIPSHDTFGRVFARLNPEAFCRCLAAWTRALKARTGGQVVALDGKKLRQSFDTALGKAAIHMVSAWACDSRLVLSQRKVDDKSNEITAIPPLLDLLEIEGCIVSIDAMGCQKEIATTIREKKAHYLLSLKGNQGALHEAVQQFFENMRACNWKTGFGPVAHRYAQSVDKGHGRIETRRCWVVHEVGFLDPEEVWTDLSSVVAVECERRVGQKVSVEVRYFISSLAGTARQMLRAVRAHWGIENRLHWVLDVQMQEDACRVHKGHAPENLAALRHQALNLLRQDKDSKIGIKNRRHRAGWNMAYLERILTQ
ncbi:MAG: ISAs1 family transposase [Pyrinomonadaceae bacterium]|nr:ISAs1 family transposase [Pyrinomonadaceae bacterium]